MSTIFMEFLFHGLKVSLKENRMKRTLTILILFFWFNATGTQKKWNVIDSEISQTHSELNDSTTIDTTRIRHVKEVDDHVVIQDSIIVEKIIRDVKTVIDQDKRFKNVFAVSALIFAIIALIYTRQKNNG